MEQSATLRRRLETQPLDQPVRLARALRAVAGYPGDLLRDPRRDEAEERRALAHRRLDLQEISRRTKADFDPTTPEARAAAAAYV